MARELALILLSLSLLSLSNALSLPACKSYPNPPKGGWKRWSNKKTWGGKAVPGINGKKARVVIPCGQGVILDKSVVLDQLVIHGMLKVVDKGPFSVTANFIIVKGKMQIGTAARPYTGKITFTLTNGGYKYSWTKQGKIETVGIKAFAVIGGQVEFNGMYKNQKPWATLTKTAKKGTRSISVYGDVSAWPVGGKIAIASTDYDGNQAETRVITKLKKAAGGKSTQIYFQSPLLYTHWGDPIATGKKGVFMNEAAEVGLLSRSIVIKGSKEKSSPLIGGHFIVFQTQAIQKITGVEFVNMGQQGNLGRYPVHFHMCQSVKGSFVKSVSIHQSNQRCVVIHGTHNLHVEKTVAFRTQGHCFVLEDGVESGNVFYRNLGFGTEYVVKLISSSETNATTSDDVPSTFWISNPNNSFISNVAAGSADSGFWFQLQPEVRGPSIGLPGAKTVYPKFLPLKQFSGNVAHSNMRTGIRFFFFGYKPRVAGGVHSKQGPQNAAPRIVYLKNVRAYKNALAGIAFRKVDSLILDGGMFADNRVAGVDIHDAQNVTVQNTIILGETANTGNPSGCDKKGYFRANCEPLYGSCSLPVDPRFARSLFGGAKIRRDIPLYGIQIDQMEYPSEGYTGRPYSQGAPYPVLVQNVTFGKFSNRCKVSAAFGGDGHRQWQLYSAGHRSRGIKFLDASPRFYFSRQARGLQGNYDFRDSGSASLFKVFHDLDGSIVGGKGGYLVTNNKVILPSNKKACYGYVKGNYAWACPGTCYRTVGFYFPDYLTSTWNLTRVSDGSTISFLGYDNTFQNLLVGSLYDIQMKPIPKTMEISYGDRYGCSGAAKFNLVLPTGYHWEFDHFVVDEPCLGNVKSTACRIVTSVKCGKKGEKSKMRIVLGAKSRARVALKLVRGNYPQCM